MSAPHPDKFKLAKDYGYKAIIFTIARIPNSSRAFIGTSDFKVCEVDFASEKVEPKELYGHESYVTGIALAGNLLVSGGYDGKLIWWDIEKKQKVREVEAHAKWIRKVVASPDGKLIASVADDMVCRLWEASSGKKLHELRGHQELTPTHYPSMLFTAAFAPDGKHLATADKVGHIVVWEVENGKSVATMEAPLMYTWDPVQRRHSIGGIRSLAFSPDGKQLAVGGTGQIGNIDHLEANCRVEVFDWAAGKRIQEFPGDKFKGLVNSLHYAPDGSWLLGAGGAGEGFFIFYDVAGKKVLRQEKLNTNVHAVALDEKFETILAVGHNKMWRYTV